MLSIPGVHTNISLTEEDVKVVLNEFANINYSLNINEILRGQVGISENLGLATLGVARHTEIAISVRRISITCKDLNRDSLLAVVSIQDGALNVVKLIAMLYKILISNKSQESKQKMVNLKFKHIEERLNTICKTADELHKRYDDASKFLENIIDATLITKQQQDKEKENLKIRANESTSNSEKAKVESELALKVATENARTATERMQLVDNEYKKKDNIEKDIQSKDSIVGDSIDKVTTEKKKEAAASAAVDLARLDTYSFGSCFKRFFVGTTSEDERLRNAKVSHGEAIAELSGATEKFKIATDMLNGAIKNLEKSDVEIANLRASYEEARKKEQEARRNAIMWEHKRLEYIELLKNISAKINLTEDDIRNLDSALGHLKKVSVILSKCIDFWKYMQNFLDAKIKENLKETKETIELIDDEYDISDFDDDFKCLLGAWIGLGRVCQGYIIEARKISPTLYLFLGEHFSNEDSAKLLQSMAEKQKENIKQLESGV